MGRRHVPPSRIRYEQRNPVVSFRLNRELAQRLRKLREKSGKSQSELLRQGLGLVETKIDDAFQRGVAAGYGRFEAPCLYCGKAMKFDIKKEEAARQELEKAFSQWHHTNCSPK